MEGKHVFMHPSNYIETEMKKKKDNGLPTVPLQDVTVWGGTLANCGEDYMSRLAYNNRNSLLRFIYFPAHFKGGMLPRPHYWQGDRGTSASFPLLRELGMSCRGDPVPYLELWDAPNLESLVFLGDDANADALRRLFPSLKTITFLRYDPEFKRLEETLQAVSKVVHVDAE